MPLRADASGAVTARRATDPTDAASAARPQASAQINDVASPVRLSETELAVFKAVRTGDVPALRVAISRGVNVNVRDERGHTALQIARDRADAEMIRILETAGAR
jgi:hypothetical protein